MSDEPSQFSSEEDGGAEPPVSVPPQLPILPLRDTVLFPNSFMPLAVARESSIRLIDQAVADGSPVGVFTQRDASVEEPNRDDLYSIGTLTHIHKMFKLADGSLRLIVQGLTRVYLDAIAVTHPYITGDVHAADEALGDEDELEVDALQRNIKNNFQQVVSLSPLLSDDLQSLAANISEPGKLADFIASSLTTIPTATKQEVLATLEIRERLSDLNRILINELEVLELGSKIQSEVQSEVGKNQREYLLREQLKAIQKELGETDEQTKEAEELREKIDAAGMPEAVKKEALRELDRLSRMPVAAAEYTVSRTYLDWMVALPWDTRTEEIIDLTRTKEVLDADHSDLEKPKDRILEYLAVRKLNPDVKGRSYVLWALRVSARPRWPNRSRHRLTEKLFASRLGACATKPRFAVIDEPILGRCPDRSFKACGGRRRRTLSLFSTRSTSWAWISGVTRPRHCLKCSIPNRTPRFVITIWMCRSIYPRSCLSQPPTCSTRFPRLSATGWRCLSSRGTPRTRS